MHTGKAVCGKEKRMTFFDDFASVAESTAKTIGKKASELATASKKAVENAAAKEKLSREYEKLGRLVAASPTLSEMTRLSGDAFKTTFENIEKYRQKLKADERIATECPSCGKKLDSEDAYCSRCGTKIDRA